MVLFSCFIQCNSNSDLNHMMSFVIIVVEETLEAEQERLVVEKRHL